MKKVISENMTLKIKRLACIAVAGALLSACSAMGGRETTGEYVDDMVKTTAIKKEIVDAPYLNPFQIHVETMRGIAQLSGFVDTKAEKEEAGRIARNVKGVVSVKNNIVVKSRS